jgi:uncharacterized membrane protein YjjP (DUF1212 family)/uncharacterized membrane protein YjjB (DUF3815 family)
MHAAGSPAHSLEGTMQDLCQLLKIKGSFISQPTAILSSFHSGDESMTSIERVEPMGVNLGKLSRIDMIARDVIHNAVSYEEGSQRLEDVLLDSDPFGKRITLFYFLFSSAGFMVLFGGHWADLAASVVVGSLMGVISLFRPIGLVAQLFEAIVAVVASLTTYILAKIFPGINVGVVILSSLIIFMPGLFITIAIAEIATQNLVSGTARLVGGVMILLKLTFGVYIGSKLASWFHFSEFRINFFMIPDWVTYVTLPVTAFLSVINFKANKEDWKWVTLAGIYGYSCSKFGSFYLGPELGMFFGGACVGGMSNIFARLKNKPSSIFQFPGIILLVPGSVGYRSLSSLFERDVVGGLDTAFTMITLALSLVVGIFFGNILVRPRQAL